MELLRHRKWIAYAAVAVVVAGWYAGRWWEWQEQIPWHGEYFNSRALSGPLGTQFVREPAFGGPGARAESARFRTCLHQPVAGEVVFQLITTGEAMLRIDTTVALTIQSPGTRGSTGRGIEIGVGVHEIVVEFVRTGVPREVWILGSFDGSPPTAIEVGRLTVPGPSGCSSAGRE